MPCVVVLHTVLTDPTPHQRQVLESVMAKADAVVAMTMTARERLAARYAVDMTKVCIIAHGAPALQTTIAQPTFLGGILRVGAVLLHAGRTQAEAQPVQQPPHPAGGVAGQPVEGGPDGTQGPTAGGGAIGESGGLFEPLQLAPKFLLANAERDGEKYAASLGAASLPELRRLPAAKLSDAGGISHPVIEPYVLPVSPYEAFTAGRQNDVPLLLETHPESRVFAEETFV